MSTTYVDSDEQTMLRAAARDFLTDAYPTEALRTVVDDGGTGMDSWQRAAALGWASLLTSQSADGLSGLAALAVVAEEAGRSLFSFPITETNIAVLLLMRAAAFAQTDLVDAVTGGARSVTWCLASDVGEWSPPLGLRVSFDRSGAQLVLNGAAAYLNGALDADGLLVTAGDGAGLVTAYVPLPNEHVRVRRQSTLDVTRRFCRIEIDHLPIPADSVVADHNDTDSTAQALLQIAQLMTAADSLGGSAAILERTVRYSQERVTFGRAIGSYQAIKHKLADMLVAVESARVSVQHGIQQVATGAADTESAVSVAKATACEAYRQITSESLQIHGGIGFTWEHDCHLFIRRSRMNEILYGTPAWHYRQLVRQTMRRG